MLTRLKVSGFKNLVDVDVSFGAFTCIAGANGVGKSNLFDAIRFLSASAQMPLKEAALSIRNSSGKQSDIRNLFHRVGDRYVDKMSFEAEMIIPPEGRGDLGQKVTATNAYLKYSLDLIYKNDDLLGSLEIANEELISLNMNDKYLSDDIKDYISTIPNITENKFIHPSIINNNNCISIVRYTDKKLSKGKLVIKASRAKYTALYLFSTNILITKDITEGHGTQFLACQEMISWQLLQLEPSPLRKANEFTAPNKLGWNGSNLAASFYHLVEKYYQQGTVKDEYSYEDIEAKVYAQVSNRLAELIDDVDRVWIDRDNQRELLTLMLKDKRGTVYPARSLSDGTLRFLALIALELDPDSFRLLCLEEPENGIYPDRLTKILQLLIDMTVDFTEPIGFDNPLRQVIINTHSSAVVQQVPEDSLLIADLEQTIIDGQRSKQARFRYLANTWRDINSGEERKSRIIAKGKLLSYLNPVPRQFKNNRVIDRPDLQSLLPGN